MKNVLAWPAYINKESNPYNYILYKEIENYGWNVFEFSYSIRTFFLMTKVDIFHLHWPDILLYNKSKIKIMNRILYFWLCLVTCKLFKTKIIWTVHNLSPHENTHPKFYKVLESLLKFYVDKYISLNEIGIKAIEQKFRPNCVSYIPHMDYQGYYPNYITKQEAREKLYINQDKYVLLFLGQIRKYKNVISLIEEFEKVKLAQKYLLIAGCVHDDIKIDLENATSRNKDVKLVQGFIDDEDIQIYMNASDLVITPYLKIFNSGSIFLNITFGKVTLAPEIGGIPEIQEIVGEDIIKIYKPPLTAEKIEMAIFQKIVKTDYGNVFNKKEIALMTMKIYEA